MISHSTDATFLVDPLKERDPLRDPLSENTISLKVDREHVSRIAAVYDIIVLGEIQRQFS
jgi:hypothetical protein